MCHVAIHEKGLLQNRSETDLRSEKETKTNHNKINTRFPTVLRTTFSGQVATSNQVWSGADFGWMKSSVIIRFRLVRSFLKKPSLLHTVEYMMVYAARPTGSPFCF